MHTALAANLWDQMFSPNNDVCILQALRARKVQKRDAQKIPQSQALSFGKSCGLPGLIVQVSSPSYLES